MSIAKTKGKGWLKDYPDHRDNTASTDKLSKRQKLRGATKSVKDVLSKLHLENDKAKTTAIKKALPVKIDLSEWCSPIEDQGEIGSCTAHAGVGMYEYFERRAFGKHTDASRLFLYKTTRNLLKWIGDDGAYLRTTMAAMALFGLCPEKYFPYVEARFNEEPTPFMYSYAQNFQALLYYRLDKAGVSKPKLLEKIKEHLANGLPVMFGFTCFTSLEQSDNGKIPFPNDNEEVDGGHAVMAVGYDDKLKIVNPNDPSNSTTGAIKIRNSWGETWGEKGYGWLPYKFIELGIADDFWTMTKAEWIDTGHFGLKNG
jgi:C1A family cysteine protease